MPTTPNTAQTPAARIHHRALCLPATAGAAGRGAGLVDLCGNFGLQQPGSVFHRSDEAVADAGDGFYVARRGCRVTQRVAEFLDGFVESVVKVDKDVGGPKALPEFVAGEYLAGAFQEHSQELQRLLRQPEFRPIPAQLPGFEIELKEAKANYVLGRRNRHSHPPSTSAN